jgi:peptidoglycan hydrolase-like protein with peptidoglycan-binding domain
MAFDWEDPPWPLVAEPTPHPAQDYTLLPTLSEDTLGAVDGYIRLAQSLLNAAGASPPLIVDGQFGPATRDAVIWYQVQSLIFPTGVIDTETWLALAADAPLAPLAPGSGASPLAGPPVALAQELLNQAGAYPYLTVDGVFDEVTQAALRELQRSRGLIDSGELDAQTWQTLADLPLEEAPLGTVRLTWSYDSAWWSPQEPPLIRLANVEYLEQPAPPSDTLERLEPMSGAWTEVWDEHQRPIFRRFMHRPIRLTRELFPNEASDQFEQIPISAPRGEFEVVVPLTRRAATIVIWSSPLDLALEDQPAQPLVSLWIDRS